MTQNPLAGEFFFGFFILSCSVNQNCFFSHLINDKQNYNCLVCICML